MLIEKKDTGQDGRMAGYVLFSECSTEEKSDFSWSNVQMCIVVGRTLFDYL
jgi:hypothetical protein